MITLYSFASPNGHKASILLEELGLTYTLHKLDILEGENRKPEYLAVSPVGKLPAVIEEMPGGHKRRLFGSGAILMHFAERTGRMLPESEDDRAEALSWLAMGLSDLGPSAMDMFRFSVRAPEKISYAIDFYKGELMRVYRAMDNQLSEREFLAGTYSIADIACYPFIAAAAVAGSGLLDRFPHLKRWHDTISARPAVQRGMSVPQ